MAKQMRMRLLCSWTEVAPALLISHNKTSTCPVLETITEDWEMEKFVDLVGLFNRIM
ncbi:hypothetical protein D8674_024515 [Pyrus ussuriensis x Pyrus communis]|uniref:Uncharacterized protein n=1 Tax=Pyrus ussuriensis x Pyrus communis TaxID=2448454 RepID=A0A5N5H6Y6_9ROSA|nr:hypothetical protein D8674_024515 [Pyrus ussuriensis x Pyrus communis]